MNNIPPNPNLGAYLKPASAIARKIFKQSGSANVMDYFATANQVRDDLQRKLQMNGDARLWNKIHGEKILREDYKRGKIQAGFSERGRRHR